MCTRTFRNDRSNRTVTTDLTNDQILALFSENAEPDNWLWFWLADYAEKRRPREDGATNGQPVRHQPVSHALAFISDLFTYAIGAGLKRPMIRLHFKDQRFKIYLSDRGTVCIKTGKLLVRGQCQCEGTPHNFIAGYGEIACSPECPNRKITKDPVGDEHYIGCLFEGRFLVAKERYQDRYTRQWQDGAERVLTPTEREFLDRLSDKPVAFFAECSKDMDRCAYCGLPLEDPRSKEVGYGERCARHWGLIWGEKKERKEESPSFAQLWERASPGEAGNVRALCKAVRANPYDDMTWLMLSEALRDAGYEGKNLTTPKKAVTVPRG